MSINDEILGRTSGVDHVRATLGVEPDVRATLGVEPALPSSVFQQRARLAAVLKPRMLRPVDLHQFAKALPPPMMLEKPMPTIVSSCMRAICRAAC